MTFDRKTYLSLKSEAERFEYLCKHFMQTGKIPLYDSSLDVLKNHGSVNHAEIARHDRARIFVSSYNNIVVDHIPQISLDNNVAQNFLGYSQLQAQEPKVITFGIEFVFGNLPHGTDLIYQRRAEALTDMLSTHMAKHCPGLLINLVPQNTIVSHSLYLMVPVNLNFTDSWDAFIKSLSDKKFQDELSKFGIKPEFIQKAIEGLKDLPSMGYVEKLSPDAPIAQRLNLVGNGIAEVMTLYERLISESQPIIENPTAENIIAFAREAMAIHAQACEIDLPDSVKGYKKSYQHAIFAAEILTELYISLEENEENHGAREAAKNQAIEIYEYIGRLPESNFKDLAKLGISFLKGVQQSSKSTRGLVRAPSSEVSTGSTGSTLSTSSSTSAGTSDTSGTSRDHHDDHKLS